MAYKHILVPYDKSETAGRALVQAVEMASTGADAVIDILYVTSMPDIAAPIPYVAASSSTELYNSDPMLVNVDELVRRRKEAVAEEQQSLFEELKPLFADIADRVSVIIQPGISPVDDIVDYSNAHECDLIVMGCRGLGALRGMLGSVSYGVLRSSSMPVLIVK